MELWLQDFITLIYRLLITKKKKMPIHPTFPFSPPYRVIQVVHWWPKMMIWSGSSSGSWVLVRAVLCLWFLEFTLACPNSRIGSVESLATATRALSPSSLPEMTATYTTPVRCQRPDRRDLWQHYTMSWPQMITAYLAAVKIWFTSPTSAFSVRSMWWLARYNVFTAVPI